jgi:hypothetical protein
MSVRTGNNSSPLLSESWLENVVAAKRGSPPRTLRLRLRLSPDPPVRRARKRMASEDVGRRSDEGQFEKVFNVGAFQCSLATSGVMYFGVLTRVSC